MVRLKSKSKSIRNVFSIALVSILIFSIMGPVLGAGNSDVIESEFMNDIQYMNHEPVRVDGDDDFNESVWAGNGSESNPYLLKNLSIDAGGFGYGVYVGNVTDNYFRIENCQIYNASGGNGNEYYPNSGIVLYKSWNGIIEENEIRDNSQSGIELKGNAIATYNNTVEDNYIHDNKIGISLLSNTQSNFVYDNIIVNNNQTGIELVGSDNNEISNNILRNNNQTGIELVGSDSNTFTYNTIKGHINGTLFKSYANSNIFHHNNFANQYNINSTNIGDNTWDNGTLGNYWSDYTGNDSDADGIGDDPYVIDSTNQDNYPLMNPIDDKEPVITGIQATPITQGIGDYVNISCKIDDLFLNEVWINITRPDNSYLNKSMDQGLNNNWYLNQSYSELGAYSYKIYANDTNDNLNITDQFEFNIIDETPPEIVDQTTGEPKTGETFNITANITDNIGVNSVYLSYNLLSSEGNSINETIPMDGDYYKNIYIWKNATNIEYQIEANDTSENENSTDFKDLNVTDKISPVIKDVTIKPEKQLKGEPVNITVKINDNIEVKNTTVNFTQPMNSSYSMKYSDGEYYYNSTYSQNGTHKFNIKALDTNNNYNQSSNFDFMIGDYIPPKVNIQNPEKEQIIKSANTTVEWQGYDNESGINRYSIKLNDGHWEDIGLDESYELTNLNDGEYEFTVKIIDNNNNTATETVKFFIDTHGPKLDIISPENDSFLNKENITIEWSGKDNGTEIQKYEIKIDDLGINDDGSNTSYKGNFASGEHNVRITAIDSAGYKTNRYLNFTVDLDKPNIEFTNIEENIVFNKSDLTINWTGSDKTTSIQRYKIKIDDGIYRDVNTNISFSDSFSEGDHKVKLKAYDRADNLVEKTINFTVDMSNPMLNITSPVNETIIGNNVTVTWNGSDSITDIDEYKIKINNNNWTDIGENTSYQINNEGSYSISIKAIDICGHETTKTINFTVKMIDMDIDLEINNGQKWIFQNSIPINIISEGEDPPSKMRIALNDDFTENSTGWIEYTEEYSYDVPNHSGEYTLYLQFKDSEDSEHITVNDKINVDLEKPTGAVEIDKNVTSEQNISISLTAQDNMDEIDLIMIDENSNFTSPTTHLYSHNIGYQLSSKYGDKTVFIKFITAHGQESEVKEISVFLDNEGPQLNYVTEDTITKKENLDYTLKWDAGDYSGIDHYELSKIIDDDEEIIDPKINADDYLLNLKDNQSYLFKLTGIDNLGNSNTLTFTIETNVNYPPTIENVYVPSEISEEDTLKVDVKDIENDDLTITWYDGDRIIGEGSEIQPDLEEGEHNIKVIISDGTNEKERSFNLNVRESSSDDPFYSYLLIGSILLILILGGALYMLKREKSGSTTEESFERQEKVETDIYDEFEEKQSDDFEGDGEDGSSEDSEDIDEEDVDLFGV
ncbi:MAG: right-handed parallel beta-helix repeat-containing protein [Thermoplasmata archaeon]